MSEVIEYLESKNIKYIRQGNEALMTCPHCGKKDKLSININTGVFHCWVCSAKYSNESKFARGHISQLMQLWGDIIPISDISSMSTISNIHSLSSTSKKEKDDSDFTDLMIKYHNDIWKNKKALKYLMKRGFSEKNIKEFKYGFVSQQGENWIAIPSFEGEVCRLLKYRKITNNTNLAKYSREPGGKSILHNQNIISNFSEIIVTEGEFDCDTLRSAGYKNVVGTTLGTSLSTEWYNLLLDKSKIILILDSDSVGQTSARDVWVKRLGYNRCWNVLLPENTDVNAFFSVYTKEDFDKYLKEAKQFKVSGIVSLQDSFIEMYQKSKTSEYEDVFELPWKNVNKLLGGGLRRYRLTLLSGIPGAGKTSLALQVCYHLASTYKMPCLFFCMEMPEVSLATKIVQLKFDLTTPEIKYSDALAYANELEDIPLYFGYSSKITPDIFYRTITEVRNRYGIEFAVFDNFHRMVRSGKESQEGQASGMFKDVTMDLGIPFILIGQPRKGRTDTPLDYQITRDDIKGSSAIPADADEVILMSRRRLKQEEGNYLFESETKIVVDKSRYSSGGITKLNFLGEKSRFEEIG